MSKKKKKTTKKVTKSYTTTSGQKVTKYSDGSETRTGGSSSSSISSSNSGSGGGNSSSQLDTLKKELETKQKELALQKELESKQAELAAKQKEEASKTVTPSKSVADQKAELEKQLAEKQAELKRVQEEDAAKAKEETKVKEEPKTDTKKEIMEKYDTSVLTASDEFKTLNADDQEAVLAVFDAIASNDQVKAKRLAEAFKVSSKLNDVYFGQKFRLAADEIERGYVEIDKEAEFKATQAENRLADIRKDYASKKDFMSLEEASTLKDIEREYTTNLDTLQTGLAEAGFTSSSRRVQKEKILNEATGSLRESKQRGFAYERGTLDETLGRSERDTQQELARLAEITKAGKLDFLRASEKNIGSEALSRLNLPGGDQMIGGVYGLLPEEKLSNTIASMQGMVF